MRVKKVKISCSLGFLAVAAVLIYLDGYVMFGWLICCLFHELAHTAAIKMFGGEIESLRLTAVGAVLELDSRRPLSYKKEAFAALAGPAVNLLLASVCGAMKYYNFSAINLSLGVLNLLPVMPLDGGRILCCVLSYLPPDRAEGITCVISSVICGILIGMGVFAWYRWGNLTLLLAALWLFCCTMK